jgi:glycosyltransferase involved in cell wall biosynthesis
MMRRRAAGENSWLNRLYLEREAGKLERFEQQQCRRAAVNLVVSELDAARLREIAPGAEVRVVENGTDPSFFAPPAECQPEPRSLVFAGGMNWYPNCDAVLYFLRGIWPLLTRDPEPRTWTVVGQDPPGVLLEAARRDPGIRVMGFVDDVRPHLHSAQIYVCPIRKGGGTRLKVLDALASGTPLVSTRMAVEGLDLMEGTHYLGAEEPADFVAQIRRLDSDPGLRQRLSTSGKDIVLRRYSWSGIGERLLDAYRFACATAGSREDSPRRCEERAR